MAVNRGGPSWVPVVFSHSEPDEKKGPLSRSIFLHQESRCTQMGKKTNKLLSTSLWTCVYLHTSSVVAGGPLHSGGRSRRCIYMTGWTWPTSGNARRPGRRRSRGRCVCAVASSTVRPCTRRSSWAGRGGRSHIPHRTGEWALGLSGLGCTSSLSVEGKIWMSQPFLPNYL